MCSCQESTCRPEAEYIWRNLTKSSRNIQHSEPWSLRGCNSLQSSPVLLWLRDNLDRVKHVKLCKGKKQKSIWGPRQSWTPGSAPVMKIAWWNAPCNCKATCASSRKNDFDSFRFTKLLHKQQACLASSSASEPERGQSGSHGYCFAQGLLMYGKV